MFISSVDGQLSVSPKRNCSKCELPYEGLPYATTTCIFPLDPSAFIVNTSQNFVNQSLPLSGRNCYTLKKMATKRKKSPRKVFDSIRKPTAPPTKRMGKNRVEEKIHPSLRKSKHKRNDPNNENS